MKTVHLVAMCVTVPLECFDEGDEVWGVNRTYRYQEGLTRLFFFDSPHKFKYPPILDDLADVDFDVYTRKPYPEIRTNKVYPKDEVVGRFGMQYFTCTVAYMIALAIYEGYEQIYLHGMYLPYDSIEYMHHIPCVNFWTGVALGRGIHVVIGGECGVARPFPWQASLYGYTAQRAERLQTKTIAAAYQACAAYPVQFMEADELEQIELQEITEKQERAFAVITDEQLRLVASQFDWDEDMTTEQIREELRRTKWDPRVSKELYTSSDRIEKEVGKVREERGYEVLNV